MGAALQGTDIATASTFLKGATEVTIRNRLLPRFLDEEGRINRNADGKDLNWKIEYKLPVAIPYTPGQPLSFANDNYLISASATPAHFIATSGMNHVDRLQNTGPTVIVDNYKRRIYLLLNSMQVKFANDLYSYAPANANSMIGLSTIVGHDIGALLCTTADRMATPLAGATYAGLTLTAGSYGGSWSNDLPTASKMNTQLGTDWPDGHGSPDQMYDATTPRLYNDNTNQWLTPGAVAGAGTWQANCIAMLSRANTDLSMNSVKTMMPNVHTSGAQRHQAIKEALRLSFRDTMMSNRAAESLGYYGAYNFEGAAIEVDHACPADRTFSVCAASMDIHFYGSPAESGARAATGAGDSQEITGGIYTTFGPERIPGTLETAWILFASGFTRYQPKWVACHKDFTAATNT